VRRKPTNLSFEIGKLQNTSNYNMRMQQFTQNLGKHCLKQSQVKVAIEAHRLDVGKFIGYGGLREG
jgi:hypothetical protein